MKKLTISLLLLVALYSCGKSTPLDEDSQVRRVTGTVGGNKKPYKKKPDSLNTVTNSKDSLIVTTETTVTIPSTKYQGKHREIIQEILNQKKTFVMEKEEKPYQYYGSWFFDIFDIDKTPAIVTEYYEKKIDALVKECVTKGDLNYDNLFKNNGSPVK